MSSAAPHPEESNTARQAGPSYLALATHTGKRARKTATQEETTRAAVLLAQNALRRCFLDAMRDSYADGVNTGSILRRRGGRENSKSGATTQLLPAALGQSPPTRAAEYGYTRTTLTADCLTGSPVHSAPRQAHNGHARKSLADLNTGARTRAFVKKHPAGQAPCMTHTHTENSWQEVFVARTEHASFPNVATLPLAQFFKRSMSVYGAWSTFQRCIHKIRSAHLHPEKFISEPNGSHSTHFTEAFSQTSLLRTTSQYQRSLIVTLATGPHQGGQTSDPPWQTWRIPSLAPQHLAS